MKEYFIDSVGDWDQIKKTIDLVCLVWFGFFFPLNEELSQHAEVSIIFELKVMEK